MKILTLPLSDEQREMLDPYFSEVRDANRSGNGPMAIAAQIYEDGIFVGLLNAEQTDALYKALGGQESMAPVAASVTERLKQNEVAETLPAR
jgi:hypothetical protein